MIKLQNKVKRVCLMGASLDSGNMGVSALAASLTKIILQIVPKAEILLFIGNKSSKSQEIILSDRRIKLKIINFRLSPKAKLKEHLLWIFILAILQRIIPVKYIRRKIIQSNWWLSNLDNCDFIGDICGGDSFSDIYNIRRFIFTILPDIIALLMGKELILLPQTYGPYKSYLARRIARFILNHSKYIYARDKYGLSVVKEVIGTMDPVSNLSFCPDVAFMLDSIVPKNQEIEPKILKEQRNGLIGLNINGLLYFGGYSRDNMFGLKIDYREFIIKLLQQLLDITSVHILLVPHTFMPVGDVNSDPEACDVVYSMIDSKFRKRIHRVMREYNQNEIKGIIGQCDFFIGSRMHACIAALSQHIPTIGVAYSRKFVGVFKSIGAEEWVVDARSKDVEEAIELIMDRYHAREEIRNLLSFKIDTAKEQILETFKNIIRSY